MTLVALYEAAPVAEKEQHMAMLRAQRVNLDLWAKLCPHNYEHKRLLVEAEVARVSGHEREAIDLYDRAIDAAKEHGFKRDEAMSSELCAKFYLSIGRTRYARAYMADAYHGYLAWGRRPRSTTSCPKCQACYLKPWRCRRRATCGHPSA